MVTSRKETSDINTPRSRDQSEVPEDDLEGLQQGGEGD